MSQIFVKGPLFQHLTVDIRTFFEQIYDPGRRSYCDLSKFEIFDHNCTLLRNENLLKVKNDPNSEFRHLLDFFGVDSTILNFEPNIEKGFSCLESPINYCLGGNKGRTQHKKVPIYEEFPELIKLKNSYKGEMLKTYMYIYNCTSAENCCKIENTRFSWLKEYFC